MGEGGYEEGYLACDRFWPCRPASMLVELFRRGVSPPGKALDVGCGEGTNAAFLAARGFSVLAVDTSETAIAHARRDYPLCQRS